jgi:hypothetical protein
LLFENTNGNWIESVAVEGLGTSQSITNFILSGVWRCPAFDLWLHPDTNLLAICYGYNARGVIDEETDDNFGLGGRPSTQTPLMDSEVVSPADMICIGDIGVMERKVGVRCLGCLAWRARPWRSRKGRGSRMTPWAEKWCDGAICCE